MVIDTNIIIDHLRTKQRTASAFASLLGKKQSIGIADIFIAATALANRQPLRTENRKHFERIPHLKII